MFYKFDNIEVDTLNFRLLAHGELVSIGPQVFDLLVYLLTNRDRLVTRQEILDAIWQEREVSDTALSNLIKSTRKAIGDDGNQQRIIKTVHGRGYQFILKVNMVDNSNNASLTQAYSAKSKLLFTVALIITLLFLLNKFISEANLDNKQNTYPQDIESIQKSIAVLAFDDLSPNKDQEYFSDGISEEILNVLAKNPNLHVISKSSAFAFKGEAVNIPEVAKKLGVKHILEGSVRKSGNRIRITAQLIASDSDKHLWSQTYDRELSTDNLFDIQDEIASEVAEALQIKLLSETQSITVTNTEAYNLYLRGKHFATQGTRRGLELSVNAYQESIALDANFAPPWAGLSFVLRYQGIYGVTDLPEAMEASRKAALRALELDNELVEAWLSLAKIQFEYDWDWSSAEMTIRTALEYGPKNAPILRQATWMALALGEVTERVLDLAQAAVELDPLDLDGLTNLATSYWALGLLQEEEQIYWKIMELYPKKTSIKSFLAAALARQGKPEEGLQYLDFDSKSRWHRSMSAIVLHSLGRHEEELEIRQKMIEAYSQSWSPGIAMVYAWHGDRDKAFEWLDIAIEHRSSYMTNLLVNPWLAPLHDDPRWEVILNKMGLLKYWEKSKHRR